MKKIILTSLVIFLFACKNEEKTPTQIEDPIKTEVVINNLFKVAINLKTLEDDKFQLFYVDDFPEGKYNLNNILARYLKGSDEFQVIEFTLPEKILPYKFRIDLGENNHETFIDIERITIKYNNEVIEIDSLTLERFFQPNIYLEKTINGYLRKKIDGRNDPFLVSTPLLIKKIELEF